ncbi:MAG TPA: UvrD-helicase domain-containing protein, partial [Steroidobacteraceae bacterium]|nr:UvrD-helicase domain-containing protein [Steroidobacteraceae bacterium]
MDHTQPPADHAVREAALNPTRSFIVEAPAGSGKTELLTRRYLRLLACVSAPEEILAITFTRKAAAEMRGRIVKALSLAESDTPPTDTMKLAVWSLAKAVRTADEQHGWQLLSHPARLRIMTIDALNSSLARQLPILSGAGATLAIARDTTTLYAEVVLRLAERLSGRDANADAIARLLKHLDNRYDVFESLLSRELARREHWLDIGLMRFEMPALRSRLESALSDVVSAELAQLRELIPRDAHKELTTLITHAAAVLN